MSEDKLRRNAIAHETRSFKSRFEPWRRTTYLLSPDAEFIVIARIVNYKTVVDVRPIDTSKKPWSFALPFQYSNAAYALSKDAILFTTKLDRKYSLLQVDILQSPSNDRVGTILSTDNPIAAPAQLEDGVYLFNELSLEDPSSGFWMRAENGNARALSIKKMPDIAAPSSLGNNLLYFRDSFKLRNSGGTLLYPITPNIPSQVSKLPTPSTHAFSCNSPEGNVRCVALLTNGHRWAEREDDYMVNGVALYLNDAVCVISIDSSLSWKGPSVARNANVVLMSSMNRTNGERQSYLISFGGLTCAQLQLRKLN